MIHVYLKSSFSSMVALTLKTCVFVCVVVDVFFVSPRQKSGKNQKISIKKSFLQLESKIQPHLTTLKHICRPSLHCLTSKSHLQALRRRRGLGGDVEGMDVKNHHFDGMKTRKDGDFHGRTMLVSGRVFERVSGLLF